MEPAQQPIRDRFLAAMGRAVHQVNVVTTDGIAGRLGATVSAMSSVSADMSPPTLLICMNQSAATTQAVLRNGVFCLNVLHESQHGVADCFAARTRTDSGDKFDCASWTQTVAGSWRLDEALASFDCQVLSATLVGTHYVIIGSVAGVDFRADARPLIYGDRRYCAAVTLQPQA